MEHDPNNVKDTAVGVREDADRPIGVRYPHWNYGRRVRDPNDTGVQYDIDWWRIREPRKSLGHRILGSLQRHWARWRGV